HLANLGQASPAFGVGGGAVATPGLFGSKDFLHDQGAAIVFGIVNKIFFCVAETMAYQLVVVLHFMIQISINNRTLRTTPSVSFSFGN
ncbi:MAG: hypothetical protein OEL55_06570, partial [Desulfobulbaceae bacterium]|nr:hypothetical protein [Desulfobulbaceae bacterium]